MTYATSANSPGPNFAEWLAQRTDAQLEALLRLRPDVATPLPSGVNPLATRLLLRSSLSSALLTCTAAEIAVLEEISELGGETHPVRVTPSPALEDLRAKALVYGSDDGSVMVPSAVIAALPQGFSVRHRREVSAADIAALPEKQKQILETLTETGLGTTKDAAADADPTRPIPQLITAGLLDRVDNTTVRLPREVRGVLRGNPPVPIPTAPSGRAGTPVRDPDVDGAGATQGLEVVYALDRLIDILGNAPVPLLKDKSVGVRHIAALDKELGTDHARALIALGFNARLLSRGEPAGGPEGNFLAPTRASAEWLDAPLSARLELLQAQWLTSPWAWWDSARGLDKDTRHALLPRYKEQVLGVYRHSAVALSDAAFWEDLRFTRPLFATFTPDETIAHIRAEATWLGIIAKGAITQSVPLPEPGESFIMQADMTVVTPGPLRTPVLRRLETLAELETPGLASVYRLTPESLRRGLDAGFTGEEILDFFRTHAVGEVPQAVSYLVADIASRHGCLRAGLAQCYLRCDDEALLAQATHVVPRLRLLAPTVAISEVPLARVLEDLRAAGFAPAAEDSTGATITAQPEPALLPTPRANKLRATKLREGIGRAEKGRVVSTDAETEIDYAAVIAAIRSGDAQPVAQAPVEVVQSAARSGRTVIISYADKEGKSTQVQLTPLSVNGGQVDALNGQGRPVRIPVPRIISARLA